LNFTLETVKFEKYGCVYNFGTECTYLVDWIRRAYRY